TFLASDPGGPGVYLVTAQIDGKTVDSGTPDNNEGRCIPIGETGGTLMFDHNEPCRASASVDLPINTPTPTQQPSNNSLGALPGPGTSASASLTRGLGQPNGIAASEGARLRLGQHGRLTRSFAKRALRIPGRLVNPQGKPIVGATLDLLQQTSASPGLKLIGHAKTSATGTFVASTPAGASRTIEVSYRAFSSDGAYAATGRIIESVQAGVQLAI